MTAPSLREAVKNAVCGSTACDARCEPEMKIKACGIVADAALAVALPILRSHFEGVAHSVAHDSLEGSTHREYFNKGVDAVAAAIRADEGPK